MRRLLALPLLALPACAAVAGLNEYSPVDCVEPQCVHPDGGDDATGDSVAADVADTATEDTRSDDTGTPPADTPPPVCAPIAPTLVAIGAWSIEATEVTNAHYAAFLAAKGAGTAGQPSYCAWNTSYVPSGGWPAAEVLCNHPVTRVDWCDAYAYCKWAGKRLCGHPSGGATPASGSAIASTSQWFAACSLSTASRYIYGATYVAGTCVDDAYDGKSGVDATDVKRRVGAATNCHGAAAPYASLSDMNGNVAEWEDSCNEGKGADDDCRVRGGSYLEAGDKVGCDEAEPVKRRTAEAEIGFRCCSP